jgi:hypothetical protein
MDVGMNSFVERPNIVHKTEMLKNETDPAKRKVVSTLLAKAVGQSRDERETCGK